MAKFEPLVFDFPEGEIRSLLYNTDCENHNYKDHIKADYNCTWGGGYEYEPANLCKTCLKEAIDKLVEFRDKYLGL